MSTGLKTEAGRQRIAEAQRARHRPPIMIREYLTLGSRARLAALEPEVTL